MDSKSGFRRTPQQERSQLTVDRILGAAAELLARDGFERTTTNAVAEAASVPIGSVYQYFGNKEAMATGLADRYLRKLRSLHGDFHATDVIGLSIEDAVDALLDPMIEFHLAHPAYSQLLIGSRASKKLVEVVKTMDQELLVRIQTFLETLRPSISKNSASRSALVILTTARALVYMMEAASDEAAAHALAAESKRMLVAYARQVVGDALD